jgi:hypothetical protein
MGRDNKGQLFGSSVGWNFLRGLVCACRLDCRVIRVILFSLGVMSVN